MYNAYADRIGEVEEAQRAFFYKVYSWMAAALALTGLIAMQVASSTEAIRFLFGNPGLLIGLMIGEIALVVVLSMFINKMSPSVATILFFVYAAVNGLTMAAIFLVYTKSSIASAFFVTGGTFAAMSAYGYFTKRDLSNWGSYLFMGLLGIIIASLVNFFLKSSMIYWITTYAGVLIFVGLTAYDTNKLKKISSQLEQGTDAYTKFAIIGALTLYLDFINLFLLLLRIFGGRRR